MLTVMSSVVPYTGMDKTNLDTSSGSLFVTHSGCPRHVERNYVPLFGVAQSNVDLQHYRPLSRRLDRCDRDIQDEVGDSNGGNV